MEVGVNSETWVWYRETSLSPPVIFLLAVPRQYFFCGYFYLYLAFCPVCVLQPCGHLLGKGWPLGSSVCDALLCFVTFPYSVWGQVWYLIVSFPDLFLLPYFVLLGKADVCAATWSFLNLYFKPYRIIILICIVAGYMRWKAVWPRPTLFAR